MIVVKICMVFNRVGTGRLELPTLAGYASETYAYTNSATCPVVIQNLKVKRQKLILLT